MPISNNFTFASRLACLSLRDSEFQSISDCQSCPPSTIPETTSPINENFPSHSLDSLQSADFETIDLDNPYQVDGTSRQQPVHSHNAEMKGCDDYCRLSLGHDASVDLDRLTPSHNPAFPSPLPGISSSLACGSATDLLTPDIDKPDTNDAADTVTMRTELSTVRVSL